jgi:hypothetical protein
MVLGARREMGGAGQIERRPRGASRMNPLLHLLQRATICQAMVVRLWRTAMNMGAPP